MVSYSSSGEAWSREVLDSSRQLPDGRQGSNNRLLCSSYPEMISIEQVGRGDKNASVNAS